VIDPIYIFILGIFLVLALKMGILNTYNHVTECGIYKPLLLEQLVFL